jgi:hypothetical protein
MKELPELIKLIKAWEVAINGTAIASFPLSSEPPPRSATKTKDYPTTRLPKRIPSW